MKKIGLIIPSLEMGGMERVMANLSTELVLNGDLNVRIIKLTKGMNYYSLNQMVEVAEPEFDYKTISQIGGRIKTIKYLRKEFKSWKPDVVLSFGDRYNSISIIASFGLRIPVFVSNRMNPYLSNGRIIDIINRLAYPLASGIIAQTSLACSVFIKRYKNKNVKVIPNPIQQVEILDNLQRQNVILNVGRFGDQKNQKLLIDYFIKLDAPGWKLIFLGDGPELEKTKKYAESLMLSYKIEFMGAIHDVNRYYQLSKIFAFTSTSEGFPNALAEAMSNGLACISFDCIAGPSDLINHGKNGYLVENFDDNKYLALLQSLVNSEEIVQKFGYAAIEKIKQFSSQKIAEIYLDFLFNE